MAAFTKHDTNGTSKDVIEENTTIEVNDFVMEIKTQKEFKVTRIVDENKFECIERDGFAIYTFGKDEIRFISKL